MLRGNSSSSRGPPPRTGKSSSRRDHPALAGGGSSSSRAPWAGGRGGRLSPPRLGKLGHPSGAASVDWSSGLCEADMFKASKSVMWT